jgi:hypothetical protein
MTLLTYAGNQIGTEGMKYLAEALIVNKGLESLVISSLKKNKFSVFQKWMNR